MKWLHKAQYGMFLNVGGVCFSRALEYGNTQKLYELNQIWLLIFFDVI